MPGTEVDEVDKSDIGLTQNAPDLGGIVGGKRNIEEPDFWDDYDGDPALENAR